jgi:hypothetical protein
MYLQMLDLLTREDVTFVQTERGLYGGRRLIAGARSVIPSGDCAKAIEEGGLVIGADILHTGQSIQLRRIISLEHLQGVEFIPATLELDDGCSMASGFCPHCIIAFEAQASSRQKQGFLVGAQILIVDLRFVHPSGSLQLLLCQQCKSVLPVSAQFRKR